MTACGGVWAPLARTHLCCMPPSYPASGSRLGGPGRVFQGKKGGGAARVARFDLRPLRRARAWRVGRHNSVLRHITLLFG